MGICLTQGHSSRTSAPRSAWKSMPPRAGRKASRLRCWSSWKKNCASWKRALSTASLPAATCRNKGRGQGLHAKGSLLGGAPGYAARQVEQLALRRCAVRYALKK